MFDRMIDLDTVLRRKSVFLFGPRSTGKSTLLRIRYPNALYFDLLRRRVFRDLSASPDTFSDRVRQYLNETKSQKGTSLVIVDEVQKLPSLLDEIHHFIESERNIRFLLTGSSARKLKRTEEINLLGGRASFRHLLSICYPELADNIDHYSLKKRITFGGLPSILLSEDPIEDLEDYIALYLTEEIKAEGLTRSIENFSAFLEASALCNTEQVNFEKVGSDAQVPPRTIQEYFKILEDTLVGYLLPPFRGTKKRKFMSTPKFYFFDCGVANALLERWHLKEKTNEFGKAFEHYIFTELKALILYKKRYWKLYYWRSVSKLEVDFVIEDRRNQMFYGIEVKGSKTLARDDFKGLKALNEEIPSLQKFLVYTGDEAKLTSDGVSVLPVDRFLEQFWEISG